MSLSIDQALEANDCKPFLRKVAVPEWGGDVWLAPCESGDWDVFQQRAALASENPDLARNMRASLVAACWADADGKLVKPNKQQVEKLAGKNQAVVGRLYDVCLQINTDSGDAAKNSEAPT